jgi:hypothetical protein
MRVALCIILLAAIAIILWLPPSRLCAPLGQLKQADLSIRQDKIAVQALLAQQSQVREEILERIRFENQWFQYKFLILGGLLAGSLGVAGFSDKINKRFNTLDEFLRSREFMLILALSVLVALMIDIHVRRNVLVISQLGTWLADYFEPVMVGRSLDANTPAGFHGWEGFLRLNAPGIRGMHESSLYSLLFWPAIHLTTLLPLATYCISFGYRRIHSKSEEQPIDLLIYYVVVAALLLFAVMSRAIPEAFEMRPLPFVDVWEPAWMGSVIAATMAALFLFLPIVCRETNQIAIKPDVKKSLDIRD